MEQKKRLQSEPIGEGQAERGREKSKQKRPIMKESRELFRNIRQESWSGEKVKKVTFCTGKEETERERERHVSVLLVWEPGRGL